MMLPFKIPENYETERNNIVLGDLVLDAKGLVLSSDTITYDFGVVSIEAPETSLNFQDLTVTLYIPNSNPIDLNPIDVIGYEISLLMDIDLYSGNATYLISSSKTDSAVIQEIVNLGTNVPFSNTGYEATVMNSSSIDLGSNNRINKPFIRIDNFNDSISSSDFRAVVLDDGVLNGVGYYEVVNSKISGKINTADRELLASILASGFFIKE